jgi:hypothetical protein
MGGSNPGPVASGESLGVALGPSLGLDPDPPLQAPPGLLAAADPPDWAWRAEPALPYPARCLASLQAPPVLPGPACSARVGAEDTAVCAHGNESRECGIEFRVIGSAEAYGRMRARADRCAVSEPGPWRRAGRSSSARDVVRTSAMSELHQAADLHRPPGEGPVGAAEGERAAIGRWRVG